MALELHLRPNRTPHIYLSSIHVCLVPFQGLLISCARAYLPWLSKRVLKALAMT
jgi:hypothetical protein